jgi:hypothetical protein
MFKLSFDTDNAAFEDAPELETARILEALAAGLRRGGWQAGDLHHYQIVRDSNGNTIGTWKLAPEEER